VESEKGPKENEDDEHPMRTDEWLVNVNLSPILLPGNSESDLFPDSRVDGDISSSQLRKKIEKKEASNNQVCKEWICCADGGHIK